MLTNLNAYLQREQLSDFTSSLSKINSLVQQRYLNAAEVQESGMTDSNDQGHAYNIS